MSGLRLAVAIAVVCAEAAADLIAARLGMRTVGWHARRLADLAVRTYRIARYGRPAETAAVEPFVYDVEILEDR